MLNPARHMAIERCLKGTLPGLVDSSGVQMSLAYKNIAVDASQPAFRSFPLLSNSNITVTEDFIMVRTRKKEYDKALRHQQQSAAGQTTNVAPVASEGNENDASETLLFGKKMHSRTFTRFRELPIELRLMIWKFAMVPRLVMVNFKDAETRSQARRRKTQRSSEIHAIPALLAVNNEARNIAIRTYTWRFTIYINLRHHGLFGRGEWEHARARVVMSPEDTLGFFRCKVYHRRTVSVSGCNIEEPDSSSPWARHPTITVSPVSLQKVAILGWAIKSNPRIVKALNSSIWDLDSILHSDSTGARTLRPPHGPWQCYDELAEFHEKRNIVIRTVTEDKSFREWAENYVATRRPYHTNPYQKVKNRDLDILACEFKNGKPGAVQWSTFRDMLSSVHT